MLSGAPKKADLVAKLSTMLLAEMKGAAAAPTATAAPGAIDDTEDLLNQTLKELSQEPVPQAPVQRAPRPAVPPPAEAPKSPTKVQLPSAAANQAGSPTPVATAAAASNADVLSARAARFGLTNTSTAASVDQLKKRSERFGVVSDSLKKLEDKEKLLERQKRFGLPVAEGANAAVKTPVPVTDEKIAARQARFGVVVPDPSTSGQKRKFGNKPSQQERSQMVVKRKVLSAEEEERLRKRRERFGLAA